MSLTLNMVGGGGGGKLKDTDAVLIVTVPTGSTVTATKGGTTLTPTMWVKAADPTLDCAIFAISASLFDAVNPWTVTATLSTKSSSKTITVDSNSEYDIILQYQLDLYTPGDVHTDVTGGWSATAGGSYVQFGNESINFTNQSQFPIVSTVGTILLENYLTLFVDISVNSYGDNGNIYAGIADSRITADNQFAARVRKTTTGRETISLDISGYTDSKYVAIAGYHSNANIYNVWLE